MTESFAELFEQSEAKFSKLKPGAIVTGIVSRVGQTGFRIVDKYLGDAGALSEAQYSQVFSAACGRYGTTLDYARQTFEGLLQHGIHDRALERLLKLAT